MTKTFGYKSVIATSTGDVAQVRSISGPGVDFGDVDTTCMDSSSNYRTFVPGLGDGGEVTLSLVYDPAAASHVEIAGSAADRTIHYWTICHGTSAGDADSFYGYVKSIAREIVMDDVITADVTIKVTGLPGYTT